MTRAACQVEITNAQTNAPFAQPDTYQPPAYFLESNELHLLGSFGRCHETIRISSNVLVGLGLTPGDYRIRAHYRNNSDGDTLLASLPDATATPFPEYANSQGVWVGDANSQEIRFTITP